MGLFDGLEGSVEECLRKSLPGFFHIILKPEFIDRFRKFLCETLDRSIMGNYKDNSRAEEGFVMEVLDQEAVIPYEAIEEYSRLGPY